MEEFLKKLLNPFGPKGSYMTQAIKPIITIVFEASEVVCDISDKGTDRVLEEILQFLRDHCSNFSKILKELVNLPGRAVFFGSVYGPQVFLNSVLLFITARADEQTQFLNEILQKQKPGGIQQKLNFLEELFTELKNVLQVFMEEFLEKKILKYGNEKCFFFPKLLRESSEKVLKRKKI